MFRLIKQVIFLSFRNHFCVGSISETFEAIESRGVSFKGSVYDFSVYYNAINKSDILNIRKYLMIKNKMK